MRIPGPGPQARCGKGVWSPEDQGDRCRVPRSFGPSGAGREQRASLRRTQYDDQTTKGTRPAGLHLIRPPAAATFPSRGRQGVTRRCGGYTSSVRLTAATFPSKGKAAEVRCTSSNPPTAGPSPLGKGKKGAPVWCSLRWKGPSLPGRILLREPRASVLLPVVQNAQQLSRLFGHDLAEILRFANVGGYVV